MSPRSDQSRKPRPPRPGRLWSAADREVTRVLLQARDDGTSLDVMLKETGEVRAGRVSRVSSDSVTLAMDPPPPQITYPALSLCFVSSHHNGRALVFVAPVRDFVPARLASQTDEIVLGLPEQIINEDVRSAFRVPTQTSGVDARLIARDGTRWAVEPLNLSVSGMLFRFADPGSPSLEVGSEVELRMQKADEEPVVVRGVIRRAGDASYGVFFPDTLRNGEVDPPDGLRRLVKHLEQDWLANRKR